MSAVEIRLDPSDLSREMSAMRVWLDQHRFEPSGFSCRDDDDGMLVCLEFKVADQAQAFAHRFGGRSNGPSTMYAAQQPAGESLQTVLSPSGVIG
jgi:hypothetical protein